MNAPALTPKQRKALQSISGVVKISRMEIEIFVPSEHDSGVADREKTDAALDQVQALGIDWGGYHTGYDAWILRRDYDSDNETRKLIAANID